jgi:3-hydroxyisobutyrate dehydrogenase
MEIATVEPGRTRIGWIGTGVMGSSMCGHLIDRGFACTVYNRTRDKAAGLLDKGAAWADSPARVAEQSDVIFTIVGFPADVRQVVLGDEGSLAGSKPGNILVDMTTSEPSLAIEIADAARQRGVWSVDAPVSGGDIGAREARLSIMIGGESPAVQALAPCWEAMGKTIVHQGVSGAGQHTKMVNQILIATNMIGVCEALLYAYRAGSGFEHRHAIGRVRRRRKLVAVEPRAAHHRQQLCARLFVEHFLKDMRIALDEADRMGLALPGLALAKQLYLALQAQGHGRDGTHALQLALATLSGLDWQARCQTGGHVEPVV